MYNKPKFTQTKLSVNNELQGETIEQKIVRILNNKEPIKEGAPLLYTERKDGVLAGYNIRTDRFEIALDATTQMAKSHLAKRETRAKEAETKVIKLDSGAEPIQGTQTN